MQVGRKLAEEKCVTKIPDIYTEILIHGSQHRTLDFAVAGCGVLSAYHLDGAAQLECGLGTKQRFKCDRIQHNVVTQHLVTI